MQIDPRLNLIAAAHRYPLLFVTISGAHLYGFPSPDSDFDLRGVHILPLQMVIGLDSKDETIETAGLRDGLDLDLVTHDVHKFFRLLLKKNGYVLEQLFSPLIVHTTPEHDELKHIARGCITRHHAHHYLGFAQNQWKLFEKESPRRIKPLLYVYRVLLTGIHLMRTGEVEANIATLNDSFKLDFITDIVERKTAGVEESSLVETDIDRHRLEYETLVVTLEKAYAQSTLPENPTCRDALNDLLIRLRTRQENVG